MKTNYTFLMALALFFSLSAFSQTAPPWDFNNTADNFVASNWSSITIGATYVTYNIQGNSTNPNFMNSNAMLDTSVGDYIAITMQNMSNNDYFQIITNDGIGGGNKFSNFSGVPTNDTGFVTRYFDMSGNANWTGGTIPSINFRIKINGSVAAGDVLIDKIEVVSAIPATPRVDYDFNDQLDAEGFVGNNSVTLSQPTAGELQLAIAGNNFPALSQSGLYSVDADANKGLEVTLINDSPKNTLQLIFRKADDSGNIFVAQSMVPNDAATTQLIKFDLSTYTTDWVGLQNDWKLQFIEAGPIASGGTIHVQQILFTPTSTLSIDDVNINQSIKLYPNPVKDLLTIDSVFNIENIEVFNMLGQKSIVQNGISNTMDTSSLSKGVYIVKVNFQDNKIATKRFIKK